MMLSGTSDAIWQLPSDGDVLVARVSATQHYAVAVVPREPHLLRERRTRAIDCARALAHDRSVDAWITEDGTHFLRLATFRG